MISILHHLTLLNPQQGIQENSPFIDQTHHIS